MSVGISQSTYRPTEPIRQNKSAEPSWGGEFLAFFFLLILLAVFVVAL